MQDKESIMVVWCKLKIPSLGITVRHHSAYAKHLPSWLSFQYAPQNHYRFIYSITRITVQHQEACWVMLNSYPEWQFSIRPKQPLQILFHACSTSTIAFRLVNVLFYQYYANITVFYNQEMFGLAPKTMISKCLAETYVKMSKSTSWQHAWEHHWLFTCYRKPKASVMDKKMYRKMDRQHKNSTPTHTLQGGWV